VRVTAGSLESLRELNRLRVVDALKALGTTSRAELVRRTGLSRSTVSTLVTELVRQGFIVETGRADAARDAQQGRPPAMLTLNPSAGAAVGIDFGHDHVRVAVSDLSRTLLAETNENVDVDHDAEGSIAVAARLVGELLRAAPTSGRVVGAGVALSAPIDYERGTVHPSAIMPGWVGLDVTSALSTRLGMPVHVDNDANLGALAEVTLGAGRNARDAAYIQISSGIGAGLIVDGRPYRGAGGTAGEIGHLLVDESGPICRCGNRGCLETLASGPALVALMRRSVGRELTVEELIGLAVAGDGGARRAIGDAGRAVGRALAALCNLFNPEMVVVGGDLGAAGEILLEPVRESIGRYALPAATQRLEVVAGVLGERANVLGALALAVAQAEETVAARLSAPVDALVFTPNP
jgi:predicted NBD/HSP70 family sugar kinase